MYVLVVDNVEDRQHGLEVHGPFHTVAEAQTYAARLRDQRDIPEDENRYARMGWTFDVVQPVKEV